LAQPNCEVYKYENNKIKYKACKTGEKRMGHYQFSREYQEALDEALAIDSTFAFAYRAKSTAYLKSGDFITWKKLMDQAVKYDPKENLAYRGWCRYQFFRDHRGAIRDIELLDSLIDYDIGHSVNGFYHLQIARALCYKAIGQRDKALLIIESQLKDANHLTGLYDYLHLGVLYLETGAYQDAIRAFKRQEIENNLAENNYYMALVHKALGDKELCMEYLQKSRKLYLNHGSLFDPYTEQMDKIYLQEIDEQIKMVDSKLKQ
jgi:tetratricopeptide (TPR) repeat protein